MAVTCLPFDNTPAATEQQWSDMARLFTPDGVDGTPSSSAMRVTAGSGLSVNIAAGSAVVRGMMAKETGGSSQGISTNPTSNPRIDLLVLRVNWTANTATYFPIEGTPAPSPATPAPVYSGTTYDLPLAIVRVEAADTITVTDRRQFLPLNGIVPCTHDGHPDPKGRPMLAYEVDTDRTISTGGDGNWVVGLGSDLYAPGIVRSRSGGSVTSVGFTRTLTGSASPVLAYEFGSGPSGRVRIGFGAYMYKDGGNFPDIHMSCKVTGTGGTVIADDEDFIVHVISSGTRVGSNVSTVDHFDLNPNGTYIAELHYRVDGSGLARIYDRYIEVQRLP